MGPMLFNWQNNVPKKSAKRIKHKKRHETQYATPADTEVIMKRRGLAASVHHTESIVPVFVWNVKGKSVNARKVLQIVRHNIR